MKYRLIAVQVTYCGECPAYRDADRWCDFSDKPVSEDMDVLKEIADFCELEEDG
jgi:hypothetical protein